MGDYYPSEIRGWEIHVRDFLRRRSTWGHHALWPSVWTDRYGRPRCARCGTTKLPEEVRLGGVAQDTPSCEACKPLMDKLKSRATS